MHGCGASSSHRGCLKRPCTYLNGPPDAYQTPSGSLYWHLIEDETHNFDAEKQHDFPARLRGTKIWPNPHPMVADGSRCTLCQNPFGPEGCFMVGSCGAQFHPPLFDLLHDQETIMPSLPVTIPFAVVFAIWIIEIHAK